MWHRDSLYFFLNVPIVCWWASSITIVVVMADVAASREILWALEFLCIGSVHSAEFGGKYLWILALPVTRDNGGFKGFH